MRILMLVLFAAGLGGLQASLAEAATHCSAGQFFRPSRHICVSAREFKAVMHDLHLGGGHSIRKDSSVDRESPAVKPVALRAQVAETSPRFKPEPAETPMSAPQTRVDGAFPAWAGALRRDAFGAR